ncbi:hypothetical protein IB024_01270 [Brucella sp. 6810]|uniref:hypothetical protein n=1 Tax=Brucella sp. 6810 TaxID=2769351 RepID=UPI00165BC28D|nr:hypothetical protein [Brucella sp. 6810]QNQ62419.1 hypothetical protein IB024_01270 [Brucella sp. 6810]
MKKRSWLERIRFERIRLKRWKHNLKRKSKVGKTTGDIYIRPPKRLSFQENYEATISFLNELRDYIVSPTLGRRRVHVDLVPLEKISVPVAIVLAAEFHRWSLVKNHRLKSENSKRWSPEIRNLLSDLGVFELLGLKRPSRSLGTDDNITLTQLKSGEKADGMKIHELQADFKSILTGFTSKPKVYDGLAEAVENAIAHAYHPEYEPRHRFAGHRWWGASCIDPNEMRLRFFIFDQGAGIPFTLPRATMHEAIREFLARFTGGALPDDSVMLKAALEVGRTRTGDANRGLGLHKMTEVVRGAAAGYLRILSGKGEIIYRQDDKIETRNLSSHIGGTLIEWSMPADAFLKQPNGDDDADDQHS